MNPLFRIDFSISDSLKIVRKSVLIYETIIIKLEQRRLSRQTALLAAGGILLQTVILTLGLFAWNMAPLLTVLCGGSVLVSAAGSAAIAVLYTRRGGEIR